MSAAIRRPTPVNFAEYLKFEDSTEIRHELIGGVLFAMVGATDTHNVICGNLFLLIAGPLRGKCQTFQGLMKLRIGDSDDSDSFYPDIMVSCSPTDRARLFRKEPVLLVEVLSPSTEGQDRGAKRLQCMQIPTLQDYVLVAQDVPQVEVLSRTSAWKPRHLFMPDTLQLPSLGLTIPVASIYDTIKF